MDAYDDVEAVGRGAFATVRRVRRRADGASLVVKKFHHPMSELTPKERAEVAQEVRGGGPRVGGGGGRAAADVSGERRRASAPPACARPLVRAVRARPRARPHIRVVVAEGHDRTPPRSAPRAG